jgi:hypothetical protein
MKAEGEWTARWAWRLCVLFSGSVASFTGRLSSNRPTHTVHSATIAPYFCAVVLFFAFFFDESLGINCETKVTIHL